MKKALLFLALAALFTSCQQDKNEDNIGIYGTWELRSISGGWGGTITVPQSGRDMYKFYQGNRYTKIDSNNVETKGIFTLNITGNSNGHEYGTITLTNPNYTDAFGMKGDTINIGSSASDGPSYQYIKLR